MSLYSGSHHCKESECGQSGQTHNRPRRVQCSVHRILHSYVPRRVLKQRPKVHPVPHFVTQVLINVVVPGGRIRDLELVRLETIRPSASDVPVLQALQDAIIVHYVRVVLRLSQVQRRCLAPVNDRRRLTRWEPVRTVGVNVPSVLSDGQHALHPWLLHVSCLEIAVNAQGRTFSLRLDRFVLVLDPDCETIVLLDFKLEYLKVVASERLVVLDVVLGIVFEPAGVGRQTLGVVKSDVGFHGGEGAGVGRIGCRQGPVRVLKTGNLH